MSVSAEPAVEFTPAERRDIAWIRFGLAVIAICLSATIVMWAVLLQRNLHLDVPHWLLVSYLVGAGLVGFLGLAVAVGVAWEGRPGQAVSGFVFGAAAAGVWPLLAVWGIAWTVKRGVGPRSRT